MVLINQKEFVYTMDCLIILITGMKVAYLLSVSQIFKQSWVSQTAWLLFLPLLAEAKGVDSDRVKHV